MCNGESVTFHDVCACFRAENGPKAKRGEDEADLWARGPARPGSGPVQGPDHRRECREERPDGGQSSHRQQYDVQRVQASPGIW